MLIGNYSVLSKHPGRDRSGGATGLGMNRNDFSKINGMRNFYSQDGYATQKCNTTAIPNGYLPPYCWVLPQSSGGMATYNTIYGSTTISYSNLVGAINISASPLGVGDIPISSTLGLLIFGIATMLGVGNITTPSLIGQVQLVSSILASGDINSTLGLLIFGFASMSGIGDIQNPNIAGILNAVSSILASGDMNAISTLLAFVISSLTGSGNVSNANIFGLFNISSTINGSSTITSNLQALAHLISTLLGIGGSTGNTYATGFVSADITPFTPLSPETLAAKVWETLASDYNNLGTMGYKLNTASSAGDPWGTDISAYPDGSAGYIVKLISQLLKNKMITDPVTGIMTVYDDNGIALLEAKLYEDASGTTKYRGQGSERREKLS